jgi:hypothetical protein
MLEPRSDMLPEMSETNQEVEETIIPQPAEGVKTEAEEPQGEETPKVEIPKGYVPYDALHAERAKRKETETRLKVLEDQLKTKEPSTPENEEIYSDEGKALKSQIDILKGQISSYEKKEEEAKVLSAYPILKDKQDEFRDYLEDNPQLSHDQAVKLFLINNNLVAEQAPVSKGLERPTGGSKKAEPKFSEADVKRLRETEPRKYIKLLRSGKLNPDDIGQ